MLCAKCARNVLTNVLCKKNNFQGKKSIVLNPFYTQKKSPSVVIMLPFIKSCCFYTYGQTNFTGEKKGMRFEYFDHKRLDVLKTSGIFI